MKINRKFIYFSLIIGLLIFGIIMLNPTILQEPNHRRNDIRQSNDYFIEKWTNSCGYDGGEMLNDILIDNSDNPYLIGIFENTTTESTQGILIKYDKEGSNLWNRTLGNSNLFGPLGAIDSSNNLYLVVQDLNLSKHYLFKYDIEGNRLWKRTYIHSYSAVIDMVIDSSGKIYLALYNSSNNIIIEKYDSGGVKTWTKTIDNVDLEVITHMKIDSEDNLIICGKTEIDTNTNSISLVKCDSDGTKIWENQYFTTKNTTAYNLEIDSNNNIYIVGVREDNDNGESVLLLKYNDVLVLQWSKPIKSTTSDENTFFSGIAINSKGDLFVSIPVLDTVNSRFTCTLSKFDIKGNSEYNATISESYSKVFYRIKIDSNDNIYLGGIIQITAENADFLLSKYLEDTLSPNIIVNSPTNNQLFSSEPPNFSVEISDPNLDTMWYSINGGQNITFTSNGTLDQEIWDGPSDGTLTLRFYANDSAGNVAMTSIDVIKDATSPSITIMIPEDDEIAGSNAPNFSVEITDPHLDTMWYSINGGQNITFTSNGTINQQIWDGLSDGTVTLRFYANDSASNVATNSVEVKKDTSVQNGNQIPGFLGIIFVSITIMAIIGLALYHQNKIIK